MARIVILGATGFIGRALVLALQARSHVVHVLARSPARAANVVPAGVDITNFSDDAALAAAIADADAVVNLAGESIAGKRWTARRKRALIASRVDVTERLAAAIARGATTGATALPVFVSASASGYYGDRGDDILDETAAPGAGFSAELCARWEAAAAGSRAARVVHPRFGVVLGREGGGFATLAPIYNAGLGGPIGGGAAWQAWVHLDDVARALVHIIEDASIAGPVNIVAPNPVRQRDFARALGRALHRPAIAPAPRLAVRAILGEAAATLLASQRIAPAVLERTGFRFLYPELAGALADLVDDGVAIDRARDGESRYVLAATTELAAPLADVFAFFSAPENLAALTPPGLAFELVTARPFAMREGALIDYKIRVAGVPLRWRTRIDAWRPGAEFVDSQLRGPYRTWHHRHRFTERDGRTIMEDLVHYTPPRYGLGPLGGSVVAHMLRRIFGYRRHAIRTRFGAVSPAHSEPTGPSIA